MKKILLMTIVILSSNLCLANSESQHKHMSNMPYIISQATIKLTPPGITNSAAYFVITNKTDKSIKLVGAESDVANLTELHEHTMANGLMKMQKIDAITVLPGDTVTFQPGGYHVMFIGLKNSIKAGDKINFTVLLNDGKKIPVTAIAGQHKKSDHGKHH